MTFEAYDKRDEGDKPTKEHRANAIKFISAAMIDNYSAR